ncbi:MAG: hypothetical protein WCL11_19395 [Verrucomicrobiota bacterium]
MMHKNMMRLVAGAVLFLLAREAPGAPSVPLALNYQGRLQLGQNGLTPGAYGLKFRLWSAPSGGTLLWAREFSPIHVDSNGVFSATLNDAGTQFLPLPLFSDLLSAFSNGPVYLGITVSQTPSGPVSSPVEITPVRQFLSAPYSLTAHLSDDAHRLVNATNLLYQQYPGQWPPSSVYGIALNWITLSDGSPQPASPLTGVLENRPDGLWTGIPVLFDGVLQASLNASSLGTNGLTFGGSVQMLQPAGQPSGSLTLFNAAGAAYGTNYQYQAPQDGMFAIKYPANDLILYNADDGYRFWPADSNGRGTVSVLQFAPPGQPFPSQSLNVMPASVGVQTVRFFPVQAGQSISLLVYNYYNNQWNSSSNNITYQFRPFGGAP